MQRVATFFLTPLIFFALFVGYFRPITAMTQDLGRHILTGGIIMQTHHVPKTNLFSYTYPNFPFINHHYLSEVVYYLVQKFVGFNGLLILSTLVALSAFAAVFWTSQKRASIWAISIVSLVSIGVLYERTDIRPELFSFLFTAIFSVMLFRFREKPGKMILLLIPLELLWTQMHIYFPIGILLVGLTLVDQLFVYRKRINASAVKLLLLTFIGCCIVTLLNPNGLQGALYPLHVFSNYGYEVEENQNIFFLLSLFPKVTIHFYELAVSLLFLTFAATWKKRSLLDWMLAMVFSFLGAQAERNMPLFVFALFIPFSISLSDLFKQMQTSITVRQLQEKLSVQLILLTLFCVLFILQIHNRVVMQPIGSGEIDGASHALDFFQEHNIEGPIFNNFDIGSYIEYRLYPREKVFVDGRPEAYPATFLRQIYIPMQEDPKLFTAVDKKYQFNTILFSHTDQTPWASQFLSTITKDPQWKIVYVDDTMIILVKNTPRNAQLVAKFGMSADSLHFSFVDQTQEQSLLQADRMAMISGDMKQTISLSEKVIQLDPKNCAILGILSNYYMQANSPLSSTYELRRQQYCQ